MGGRLNSYNVEEKSRRRQLAEIQENLRVEQAVQQSDTLHMQKNVMILQERVSVMNEENQRLGEKHKTYKLKIAEQQNLMKSLDKRIKDLSRQVEFLSGHLNEGHLEMSNPSVHGDSVVLSEDQRSQAGFSQAGVGGQTAPTSGQPQSIQDFYNLPGLDLEALLGDSGKNVAGSAKRASK